jgi:DNA-binding Xre family transcriptional regulator
MPTLRDVWQSKSMNSTQVAAAAGITTATLYRMNRKEEDVLFNKVQAVCKVLGMSLDEYAALDPCPQAERYRK